MGAVFLSFAAVAAAVPKASSVAVSPGALTVGGSVSVAVTIYKAGGDNWVGGVAYIYVTPPGGAETVVGTISNTAFGSGTTASFSYAPASAGTWRFRAGLVGTYQNGPTTGSVDQTKTAYKDLVVSAAGANQAPSVGAIVATPASPYEGASVTLSVVASDADGTVASVKFYSDGALVHTDTSSPYAYSFSRTAPGSRSFTAMATDNLGATKTSAAKSVSWINQAPVAGTPTLSATAVTVGGSVVVTAHASDPGGLRYVRFYRNNILTHTVSNPSAGQTHFSWTYSGAVAGSHAFKVSAEDHEGSTTMSGVATAAAQEGLAFDTSVSPGPPFGAYQEVGLVASSAVAGTQRVDFYLNGQWQRSDAAAPFTYSIYPTVPGVHTVEARFLNALGSQIWQTSRTVEVVAGPPPFLTDRWVDVNGDGAMDYVSDVVINYKAPVHYQSYINYGAPSYGSFGQGALLFYDLDYTKQCYGVGNLAGMLSSFIWGSGNGFGDRWGWLGSWMLTIETCSYQIDSISGRMDFMTPEPGRDYQLQTQQSFATGGWVSQGPPQRRDPNTGFLRKIFGDWKGISQIPALVRIVALTKVLGSVGNPTPPAPVSIGDVDGDGLADYERSVEPEVTDIQDTAETIGNRIKKILKVRVPVGVIVNNPSGGNVIQVKVRTLGDVLFEKTVEYVLTGSVTVPFEIDIPGLGDSRVEVKITYLSSRESPIYVPIDDGSGDYLVAVNNPYHGGLYDRVRLETHNKGTGRLKIWNNQQKQIEYPSGYTFFFGTSMPSKFYIEGSTLSDNAHDIELTLERTLGTGVAERKSSVSIYPLEVDVREAAQQDNRIGLDDASIPLTARNQILVWGTDSNKIAFEFVPTDRAHGPVWVQIDDISGLNPTLPRIYEVHGGPLSLEFTIAPSRSAEDFVVKFGKDLDGNGVLEGGKESLGQYTVYGISRSEYQNAQSNFTSPYLSAMFGLEKELQTMFAKGRHVSALYRPDSITFQGIGSERLTHVNGASLYLSAPSAYGLGGRPFHRSTAEVFRARWNWNPNPGATKLILDSSPFRDGIIGFLDGSNTWSIGYNDLKVAFNSSSQTGQSRNLVFSLSGAKFDFGFGLATASIFPPQLPVNIGLGGVTIGGSGLNGSGSIAISVTRIDPDSVANPRYSISQIVAVDMVMHDLFDFNYFNPAGVVTIPLFGTYNVSQDAATIQTAFKKSGSLPFDPDPILSIGRAGQVVLAEFEIISGKDLGVSILRQL